MFGNHQSSNPVLTSKVFTESSAGTESMTLQGVLNKSLILLGVLVASAGYSWNNIASLEGGMSGIFMLSLFGSLALAFITYSMPHIAPITAPLYCVIQGVFLGVVSRFAESMYPGIVTNAIVLTFGILFFMLMAYKNGYIRATPKLQRILMFGMSAYMLLIVTHWIMSMFGTGLPSLFSGGLIGIGFSLLIVGMASFFLILDFDQIETSIRNGAPKQLEWVSAFGLMVTLIWLYMEVLRLLMKLQSSDD